MCKDTAIHANYKIKSLFLLIYLRYVNLYKSLYHSSFGQIGLFGITTNHLKLKNSVKLSMFSHNIIIFAFQI